MYKLQVNKGKEECNFLVKKEKIVLDNFLRFVFEGRGLTEINPKAASNWLRSDASRFLGFYVPNLDFKEAMVRVGIKSSEDSRYDTVLRYRLSTTHLDAAAFYLDRGYWRIGERNKAEALAIFAYRGKLIEEGVISPKRYWSMSKEELIAYNTMMGCVREC